MPILRQVNLPAPLIVQSVTSIGLGLYTLFLRKPIYTSTKNGYSLLVPSNPTPRMADTISILGLAITGLQSAYLIASYMPLEENQFAHASVPARLFLAACLVIVCVVHRKSMSAAGFWELIGLATVDGAGAIALGLRLGRFDGMVKDAEKWL
jgi:hypothetical protein